MWSVNDNVWKIAPVCGEAVCKPRKHTGMTPANQRGRRSILRQRRIRKTNAMHRMLESATRNLEVLLSGGNRGQSN